MEIIVREKYTDPKVVYDLIKKQNIKSILLYKNNFLIHTVLKINTGWKYGGVYYISVEILSFGTERDSCRNDKALIKKQKESNVTLNLADYDADEL